MRYFGASDHVVRVKLLGDTGRGEPIADGFQPLGQDVSDDLVFISSTSFDHSRFMDGMALNLKIHPSSLKSDDGITKLEDKQGYFEQGGMEVQYNVVDAATLRRHRQSLMSIITLLYVSLASAHIS